MVYVAEGVGVKEGKSAREGRWKDWGGVWVRGGGKRVEGRSRGGG